jgi:hypothetical protein
MRVQFGLSEEPLQAALTAETTVARPSAGEPAELQEAPDPCKSSVMGAFIAFPHDLACLEG